MLFSVNIVQQRGTEMSNDAQLLSNPYQDLEESCGAGS